MFRFNAMKATQAMGVLLRSDAAQAMGKMRLLKLLYIADRESLLETGRPILGSRAVAMDHGPLHLDVLTLINGQHVAEKIFSAHFALSGYVVRMQSDPGVGELSRYQIAKLQEVAQRYATLDDGPLAHVITHAFLEWQNCYVEGTSKTIPMSEIINAIGREDDAGELLDDLKEQAKFEWLLSNDNEYQ